MDKEVKEEIVENGEIALSTDNNEIKILRQGTIKIID